MKRPVKLCTYIDCHKILVSLVTFAEGTTVGNCVSPLWIEPVNNVFGYFVGFYLMKI